MLPFSVLFVFPFFSIMGNGQPGGGGGNESNGWITNNNNSYFFVFFLRKWMIKEDWYGWFNVNKVDWLQHGPRVLSSMKNRIRKVDQPIVFCF